MAEVFREELLDPSPPFGATLEETPPVPSADSGTLPLEDDSSSSTAELRALFSPDALVEPESSPQALKANSAKATALVSVIFFECVHIKTLLNVSMQILRC